MPVDAVLPAFLIAVAGYFAKDKLNLDTGTLSRVCLYILTPALALNSLSTSEISISVAWRMVLSGLLMAPTLLPIFRLTSRLSKSDPEVSRSLALPAVFSNAGNYGLPVCLFAFGQEGMDLGIVFMVSQTITITTLGVYIAASNKMNARSSFKQVLKMPSVYAVAAGLLVRVTGIQMPVALSRPVSLLSQAAVPIFLLVLGMQLSEKSEDVPTKSVMPAVVFRLGLGPAIMSVLGFVLGLRGLPYQVMVLQAAMPSPVNATILAREFNAHPSAVSKTTLINTIGSLITLTLWIVLLRRLSL